MHSRIFQVSDKPIEWSDYLKESDYWDHWFTHQIADYVSDDCDRRDDIDWLKECIKGVTFEGKGDVVSFKVNSKEAYFTSNFNAFKEAINQIKDCTIEEFVNGLRGLWKLKSSYEDKYGFYVDYDGDLMSFDSFIRMCKINETYYIGNTIDYHF